MKVCHCGSGLDFKECCAPLLSGTLAPTAEALMRSRYTAYVLGNIDYIEQTSTKLALEDFDRAESEHYAKEMEWGGLDVLQVTGGGASDQTGRVEFIFHSTHKGTAFTQHELADFCRDDNGHWLYNNSEVNPKKAPVRLEQIGRNDPCPCGSGKKHKKCCGA